MGLYVKLSRHMQVSSLSHSKHSFLSPPRSSPRAIYFSLSLSLFAGIAAAARIVSASLTLFRRRSSSAVLLILLPFFLAAFEHTYPRRFGAAVAALHFVQFRTCETRLWHKGARGCPFKSDAKTTTTTTAVNARTCFSPTAS